MKTLRIACLTPPHYDYLCATLIEGLLELGHDCHGLEASNYLTSTPTQALKDFVSTCDLIVIFSGNLVDPSPLKTRSSARVVFVDGTDLPELSKIPVPAVNHIFKRELLSRLSTGLGNLISPLQFGIEKRYIRNVEKAKTYDISFVGSMSNFLRSAVDDELKGCDSPRVFSGGTGEVAYNGISGYPSATPKYYQILDSSVASIDVPGRGWDCGRTWEIIGAKAGLVRYRSEILMPNPLVEGQHFQGFSSLQELKRIIVGIPARAHEIREMANECFDYSMQHHTTKRRAEYFLNEIFSKDNPLTDLQPLGVKTAIPAGDFALRRLTYRTLRRGYNRIKRSIPTAN